MQEIQNMLSFLPAVGELDFVAEADLRQGLPRLLFLEALRASIETVRADVLCGRIRLADKEEGKKKVLQMLADNLKNRTIGSLQPVINASGVLLHTNLGRAPLSQKAVRAMAKMAGCYCNLEWDLPSGKRSARAEEAVALLKQISGAEAAMVVNNNAAALLLVLNTLAFGKEVLVSRGELVEIGGSFRIPDILAKSGAILKEVGSTNKTRIDDYRAAITSRTALILRVHRSNFTMSGFTESPSTASLLALAKEYDLPFYDDLGSAVLMAADAEVLVDAPNAGKAIQEGVPVLSFSGDKLLGGPQAGILLGQKALVAQMAQNPLYRALRMDKTSLAALAATVQSYLDPETVVEELPFYQMLHKSVAGLTVAARHMADKLQAELPDWTVEVTYRPGEVGGGALPGVTIPSVQLKLGHADVDRCRGLMADLRQNQPPIVGYLHQEACYFDLRTLLAREEQVLSQALRYWGKHHG